MYNLFVIHIDKLVADYDKCSFGMQKYITRRGKMNM